LVAAYAGLSHYSNATGARELGAALAVAPLTSIAVILAWRETAPVTAMLLNAAVAGLLYAMWPSLTRNYPLVYLLQEGGVYALLGITFGRSLLRSRTAVCTRLADALHGPLSPREVRYTRQVTAAWTVFFFAIAAISILLYLSAPLRVWSLYINLCVPLLVAAMFVAEYFLRGRILPQQRRGLMATVRVYFHTPPSS
jgi:uncharacterized membrane protein